VCAPSRSALASGLRCSHVGVLSNSDLYPLEVPTYYQVLRNNGYRIGCVGKTDLHKRDHWEGIEGNRPIMYRLGFTDPMETEGKCSAARYVIPPVCPYTNYLSKEGLDQIFHDDYASRNPIFKGRDSALPLHAYHDDYIGRNACNFLRSVNTETPWHYFVSFVGPHDPWDAPKEYSRLYDPDDMPGAIEDPWEDKPMPMRSVRHGVRTSRLVEGMTEDDLRGSMRQYAGMISLVDDYIGRFVEVLEDRGMRENTVIIYTSDHGEMMGDHRLFGKVTYYEGALRVPLIFNGPGIKSGVESDLLAMLADCAPTILDIAGLECPFPIDSPSLLPTLSGEGELGTEFQVSELAESRMIFDGRFKFAEYDGNGNELYDLDKDPSEITNLVGDSLDRADKMREKLHSIIGL
jgi:choline-sulfatase